MELQEFIERMKDIQKILLDYIDNGDEEEYNCLIENLSKSNVIENRNELKSIIQLVASIADNHHRSPDFFPRIKKILNQFKEDIRKTFSNSEIYDFFHLNKTILLFLLQEKLILPENLLKNNDDSYQAFFYPEIESKIDEYKKSSLFENFEELKLYYNSKEFDQKRQIGENDSYICSLIRNDSIEEFIQYVNKQNLSLFNTKIKNSIFETNLFLIKQNEISIIEYATFFGSFQIIQYLRINKIKINSKIWLYAIHGSNVEMIQTLEENKIKPEDSKYIDDRNRSIFMAAMIFLNPHFHNVNEDEYQINYSLDLCLKESIKCHHNEIYNYIKDNSLDYLLKEENNDDNNSESIKRNIVGSVFKNRNYYCFPNDIDEKLMLFYFCKYDYVTPVELILKSGKVNINEIIIQKKNSFF